MLFVVRWTIPHTSRGDAIARFIGGGGAPPDGVQMLSRYHSADGEYGFAIAEANRGSRSIGRVARRITSTTLSAGAWAVTMANFAQPMSIRRTAK